MSQYAPPSQVHVWARDLKIRAVLLPRVRGLLRRSIKRATR